ncbi:c-type cytochrome [Oligoflexus tunisiensis]|uniref:c-type cytochrome n=1 Tax=Oligoflexus tunisiensis TaxID=708132 RepID=UPI00159F154B|nr:cytochrome c [Oligoflexus tunisiensis]
MQGFNVSFLWIILIAGVLTLFLILGNFFGLGLHRFPGEPRRYSLVGNSQQGRVALEQYGCGSCHIIPGVREAHGRVGPSLARVDEQIYLAGHLPNDPENLMRWIMDPQSVDPKTLMPDLNVSRSEAEDMAAYLYEQPRTPLERFKRELQYMSSENIP